MSNAEDFSIFTKLTHCPKCDNLLDVTYSSIKYITLRCNIVKSDHNIYITAHDDYFKFWYTLGNYTIENLRTTSGIYIHLYYDPDDNSHDYDVAYDAGETIEFATIESLLDFIKNADIENIYNKMKVFS